MTTTRIAHPLPLPLPLPKFSPSHPHSHSLGTPIFPEPSLLPFFRPPTTTMLCSAPPGKSGSNWLDRLRSNRGIPTGDNLDLDSFLLTTAHSHSHNSLDARPHNPTRTRSPETHDPPMSTVLAELFNMGATLTQTQTFKKCPRKQTHPKFFLASSSSATTTAIPTVPATNSSNIHVVEAEVDEAVDRGDDEEENDKEGHELKGFSRSEVTVIDTSCPGWKVDKFVFRKNNVWKVRERKPKSRFLAKKKSNATLVAHGHDDDDDSNGIGTSTDNVINMRGEKPVRTQMLI